MKKEPSLVNDEKTLQTSKDKKGYPASVLKKLTRSKLSRENPLFSFDPVAYAARPITSFSSYDSFCSRARQQRAFSYFGSFGFSRFDTHRCSYLEMAKTTTETKNQNQTKFFSRLKSID